MKVFLSQRYENEAFESLLVKPTTKFEKDVLKILKGDLIIGDYTEFHPEKLGEKLCRKYAAALGYPVEKMEYNPEDWMSWWEDDPEFPGYRYFNEIPSNIEVIEAAYKMAGKYRKLAHFRKEVARLEKVREFRFKRIENDLFWKKIEEVVEAV